MRYNDMKHLRHLLTAFAALALACGLAACDDGKIYPDDPETGAGGTSQNPGAATLDEAVDQRVFAAHCAQCHGGSTTPAAGLYLTEDYLPGSLVNVPSTLVDGATLMTPGFHEKSLVWEVVATDRTSSWRFDHSKLLDSGDISLLATWIDLHD